MKTTFDINVKLLNEKDVRQFFKRFGEVSCVCYDTDTKYKENVGKHCFESEHFSGSRGFYFIFEIECPRYTADQLMRQEVGVFKNCQSQRYVEEKNIEFYVPNVVLKDEQLELLFNDYEMQINYLINIIKARLKKKGYNGEQMNDIIRTLYPIGCFTKLRIGFTLEALINLCNKRLCQRADLPIRIITKEIKNKVCEILPELESVLVPKCEKYLYCNEGKGSCGKYPSKENLIKQLNGGNENGK